MKAPLRAVVLGCGFAGQGHAHALRACGVQIEAITGRNEAIVSAVAKKLQIPQAITDWAPALATIRPDIVAVATPGGTHVEMIRGALEHRCHLFVEKPLANTVEDAGLLYRLAEAAGVKTAYAASFRYQPSVPLARELILTGEIGPLREIECVSHYRWPRLASFGWPHRLETGGGRLNNNFTHKLAIVLAVTAGKITAVAGETRNDLFRAPVGPPSHDFRDFARSALTAAEATKCEWREVNSDWAYTVLARISTERDASDTISATFRHSALTASKTSDYIAFYGEEGTIHVNGGYAQGPLYVSDQEGRWRKRTTPKHILKRLPGVEDDVQRNWNYLAREFVADIRGEGDAGYLRFRDGWKFQEIIDAVRRGSGWTQISDF